MDDAPMFCGRCSRQLVAGRGDHYVVRIEAVADPAPPAFGPEDLQRDHAREIEQLVRQMHDLSQQEALDQVYRRLVLYLCTPCFRQWIENPTGDG